MDLFFRRNGERVPVGTAGTLPQAAEMMRRILINEGEEVSFFRWEFADQYGTWIVRWGNPDACFHLTDLPENIHDQRILYEEAQNRYKHLIEWDMDPLDADNCHTEEEKRQKGMLVDEAAVIDFPLSRSLRRQTEALEECYEIGSHKVWKRISAAVQRTMENDLETGWMTLEQKDRIEARYGFVKNTEEKECLLESL